jgi:hypothetical protein
MPKTILSSSHVVRPTTQFSLLGRLTAFVQMVRRYNALSLRGPAALQDVEARQGEIDRIIAGE